MKSLSRAHALELAQVLDQSADSDGCHLGPSDASIAAAALRRYGKRRNLFASKGVALAGVVMAAVASPAFADIDGDGQVTVLDAHAVINLIRNGSAKAFTRTVEFSGARFRVDFQYLTDPTTDQRIVNIVPLDEKASTMIAAIER